MSQSTRHVLFHHDKLYSFGFCVVWLRFAVAAVSLKGDAAMATTLGMSTVHFSRYKDYHIYLSVVTSASCISIWFGFLF